jgi:hypothetical protein
LNLYVRHFSSVSGAARASARQLRNRRPTVLGLDSADSIARRVPRTCVEHGFPR